MNKIIKYSFFILITFIFTACGGIHTQIIEGNFQGLKKEINAGKNIETRSESGRTPLVQAAFYGNLEMVRYLVSKGANLEAKNNNGFTALLTSSNRSHIEVVRYLLEKGANLEAKTNEGFTALLWAINENNLELVKYLISKGANVNVKSGIYNPIYWAVDQKYTPIVKHLIENGANIEIRGGDLNRTPLLTASSLGKLDIVQYLISKGAKIEARDDLGLTALLAASNSGKIVVVKYLLEQGADVKARDTSGNDVYSYMSLSHKNYFKELQKKEKEQIVDKKAKKEVSILVKKKKYKDLKKYTQKNPASVKYIKNDKLRLLLTGPKNLKVGDIHKLIKAKKDEIIILSLIKRVKTPYKEFTLEEIESLEKLGFSSKIIATMIDVTTKLEKEKKNSIKQETRIIYKNQKPNNNSNNGVLKSVGDELINQGVNKLLEKLF